MNPEHAKLVESLSYRSDPWSFDAVAVITSLSAEVERLNARWEHFSKLASDHRDELEAKIAKAEAERDAVIADTVRTPWQHFRLWLSCLKDEWRYRLGIDKPVPPGRRATVTFGNVVDKDQSRENGLIELEEWIQMDDGSWVGTRRWVGPPDGVAPHRGGGSGPEN